MTITVLGLNERGLPSERQEHYSDIYNKLIAEYVKRLNGYPHTYETTREDIAEGKKKYTFVSRNAFRAFKNKVKEYEPEA